MGKSKAGQEAGVPGEAGTELAELLRQSQEEIAKGWAELVHGLPGHSDLCPDELLSFTSRGLTATAEYLETGSRAALEQYLAGICPASGEAIPDVSAVTEALLLCGNAAWPVIREASDPDFSKTRALISELDACQHWMVGRLTGLFAAEMSRQLEAQRAQAAMYVDIAQFASSTLDLDQVVSRVAEAITKALGVDRCMFYLVNEDQRSVVQLLRAADWSSRVSRSFDSFSPSSMFHEVLTTRRPVMSYDAPSDSRIPKNYKFRDPETKSAVLVPLMVYGKVIAMAGAYTVNDYRHFTEEEIALVQGIADVLGLVLQSAQLYEKSKLLTVMEERGRLAREIHDGLSQTLGALQLKASQLEDTLSSERVAESQGYLSELQQMISRAYHDLREAMLGLRAVVEPGAGLVAALREYLKQYQEQYGLEARLDANDGEPAILLDGQTQAQAMRIVQEALRNVFRHAGTDRVTVRIERHGDRVQVCVLDEGQGFDADLVKERGEGRHLGLRTMSERAESVNGTLAVESLPGKGTRVVLELPLSRGRGGA